MMRIFWEECKHILRSRLLWCVALLGFFASLYLHSVSVDPSLLTVSNGFVREHGTSFTEQDADDFVLYYLEHTEHGKEVQQELKQLGLSTITPSQIMRYQRGKTLSWPNACMPCGKRTKALMSISCMNSIGSPEYWIKWRITAQKKYRSGKTGQKLDG